jgi:ParB-like chromosome segregation protein Spo0J
MENHELANFFPMQDAARLAELAEGMKKSGYRAEFPIVLYEGKILDGRNRYKAAQMAGVEPSFVEFAGDDAVAFVEQANANRRDLEPGQRYAIIK